MRPVPFLMAAASALALLGCFSDSEPSADPCAGAPTIGAVTLWTPCAQHEMAGPVPVVLTNSSAESIWIFHDCAGDEVPWPERQQPDGTWERLLPADYFLTVECEHVHEVVPGESVDVPMSTQHVTQPGTYRAQLLAAYGCVDAHHPLHVGHSCDRVDYVASEPFELR
jgi:hypothetical protein